MTFRTTVASLEEASDRHRHVISYFLMLFSSLALLPAFSGYIHGDVYLYQSVTEDLLSGKLPYRDRILEYPPYAIPIFMIPRLFGESTYPSAFMGSVLIGDWLIKLCLYTLCSRRSRKISSFLPLLAYCISVPFLRFFLLQRYDVWPALICVFAFLLYESKFFGISAFLFAIASGAKVYPLLFLPPLWVLAARQNKAHRFAAGAAIGMIPLVLLGLVLPWWRFALFHNQRGLQCESLYASLIWLGNCIGLLDAQWGTVKSWIEVQGPLAMSILPWSRLVFIVAVLASVALVSLSSVHCKLPSAGQLARMLLVPLLSFVAFNQVLSPQYMVWILPIAAIAMMEPPRWPFLLIIGAAIMTPVFYPALPGHYLNGLNLLETSVLAIRDSILVFVWLTLARDHVRIITQTDGGHLTKLKQMIIPRSNGCQTDTLTRS